MNSERIIRIVAGTVILTSLFLANRFDGVSLFDHPTWLWLTAFVGANLLQSGFTQWCLLGTILDKFGVPSGGVCATK